MDAAQMRFNTSCRPWHRPHVSTWLLLLLPTTLLLLANIPGEYYFDWNDRRAVGCEHGWPCMWLMRQGRDRGTESLWALTRDVCYVDSTGLADDMVTAIAILASVGALAEWRRRRRHRACQFTLVDWMVVVGVLGWLLADIADRREQVDRVLRAVGAAGGDIYNLEVDLPTWLREIVPDSNYVDLLAWRLGMLNAGNCDYDLPADEAEISIVGAMVELSPDHTSITVSRRPPSNDVSLREFDPAALRSLSKLRHLTLERADDPVLDCLDSLNELRSLSFDESCDPLSETAAAHLKHLTHLRFLSATRRCLGDAGVAAAAQLAKLEAVSLSGATDADLAALASLERLRYLTLLDGTVTDAGLAPLAACTNLEELTVSSRQVTGAGLAALTRLRRLRTIDLSGSGLSDAGLAGLRCLTSLVDLSLRDTPIAGPGLSHLAALPRLRQLDLSLTDIDDGGIAFLPELPALEELHLNLTRVTERGISVVDRAAKLKNLWLMYTRVASLRDVGFQRLPELELLVLDGSRVDREEKRRLLAVRPELKSERWYSSRIFPVPFERALAKAHEQAAQGVRPVVLAAEGAEVGDRELALLCALPRLDTLCLQSTRVTDEGLTALWKFDELAVLDLAGAPVSDVGLAQLAKLPQLSAVDLSYTDVTDAGLKRLAEFPALQMVSLDPSQITDNVVSRLKRIPNLKRLSIHADWGRWGKRYRAARTLGDFIDQLRSDLPHNVEVVEKDPVFWCNQLGH